ncbi:MAG: SusD/RagB family nutrient-binding outer membrane lipoprotein [Porphyromonas sp.]|nr:SusD/RagB family nutrient-binding outer membrane lipoprotein [Porphyromonas sp.]
MNRINSIVRILCLTGVTTILLSSCFGSFEEINKPLDKASKEDLQKDNYVGESFLADMLAWAFPQQENRYQHTQDLTANQYGRYLSNMNDGFLNAQFPTYNAKDSWLEWPYINQWPKMVTNLKELEGENGKENITYAWAEIINAHALLQLTDTYGPFPIGSEDDPAAYIAQKDVYARIISDLDHATSLIGAALVTDPTLVLFPSMDKIYGGKMASWYKFANSMKLRIALRISGVEPETARTLAENAIRDGVITTNSDNALMSYYPAGMYKISVEWGDSHMSADMDVYLNGFDDPRRLKMFMEPQVAGPRQVMGCLTAARVQAKEQANKLYSKANFPASKKHNWFGAAEVAFLRAEGALLGWNMGISAKEAYEQGVKLSFEEWQATGVDAYLNDDTNQPSAYTDAPMGYSRAVSSPSDITVKWEDADSDARKLERIMVQKWIAMFPNGHEAWAQIRRTGYPKILPLAVSTPGYTIPTANRIPYPTTENVKNPEGYRQMLSLLGGENNYETKMWWQK